MMNKFGSELGEFLEFNNISDKDFAERIGTSTKNLNDIINGTIELSQNMIYNISFITDIPVSYIENVESNFKLEKRIEEFLKKENISIREYINRFHYKEFSKEYHYLFSNERNDYSIAKDILKYLRISSPEILYSNTNSIFYKSKNDKPELLALWLERCYKVVSEQRIKSYSKDNIPILVEYIKECASNYRFEEQELIHKFNECGIYLAIENDLKSSKIRGAFKVLNDKPAIYITRKHKRYADIYFSLLHELAHCKSDFNRAKSGSIISLEDENSIEDYEKKADETAYDWMVSNSIYNSIKNNYSDIEKLDIIKPFFVYRLVQDNLLSYSSSLYQKYNPVIE